MDVVDAGGTQMARLRADPAIRAKVRETEAGWRRPHLAGVGGGAIAEMLR